MVVTRPRWRGRALTFIAVVSSSLLLSFLAAWMFPPRVQGSACPPHTLPPAPPRKTLHLLIDHTQKDLKSYKKTVAAVLAEAHIKLGPKDEVFPDRDQPAWNGMPIFLCRVHTRVVARDEPIPYHTSVAPSESHYRRFPVLRRSGRAGLLRRRYQIVLRDGRKTEQRLLSARVLRAPVTALITAPPRFQVASRGFFGGRRVFQMVATAYDPGPGSCGDSADGITAVGMRAGHGVVAVDPSVIPLRSRLYVAGYGYCVAGDVGGAIKGNRIDLGFRSRGQALQYGRRPVTVWVLD
jgi:3D (Asp-Asp-Asp) domain-containing protein